MGGELARQANVVAATYVAQQFESGADVILASGAGEEAAHRLHRFVDQLAFFALDRGNVNIVIIRMLIERRFEARQIARIPCGEQVSRAQSGGRQLCWCHHIFR